MTCCPLMLLSDVGNGEKGDRAWGKEEFGFRHTEFEDSVGDVGLEFMVVIKTKTTAPKGQLKQMGWKENNNF